MRGGRSGRTWLIIGALVFSLAGSLAYTWLHSGVAFSYIVDSYADEARRIVIDDDGDTVRVLAASPEGRITGAISLDKIGGGTYTILDHLQADGSRVYVYKRVHDIVTNRVLSEEVCLCDFDRKRLSTVWLLPPAGDGAGQNAFGIKVSGGRLRFVTVETGPDRFAARAVLHEADLADPAPRRLAAVDYDIGVGFTDFFAADNGALAFTTPDGRVLLAAAADAGEAAEATTLTAPALPGPSAGGEADITRAAAVLDKSLERDPAPPAPLPDDTELPLFRCRELAHTILYHFTGDGKNTVYYMDLVRGGLYGIDLDSGRESVVIRDWADLRPADGGDWQPWGIKNLRFRDDAHFSAALSSVGGNASLLVFDDGVQRRYAAFTRTADDLRLRGLLCFACLLAAFLLLYILKELFLLLTRGRVPIVTKMILVFIPVVVAGLLILQNLMSAMSIQTLVESQYKELYLVSRQQIGAVSPGLLEAIDLRHPYEQVYYYTLRQILSEIPSESRLAGPGEGEGQDVCHFSYHWLHKVENGRLVSLYCDQQYTNVPVDYLYDRDTAAMFHLAMQTGQTYRGDFRDAGGAWIVLAIPIPDENGNTVAVLETGITKTALAWSVAQSTGQIRLMVFFVMLVLILLLSAILLRSLAPLKELRERVQEIIHGRLGVQTRVRGRDEVAQIGQAFNQMSSSIEYHVNELTSLKDGYFRFVPSKMFQILHKSSVIDVRLGDQTQGEISILSFNAVDFDKMARAMTGEQMFSQINLLFSNLVPIVNENDGVVDRFVDAGLVAFYTNGSEKALITAISVCQRMDIVNTGLGFGEGRSVEVSHGISHGPVMIGIVGHEERLAATTISEYTNLSDFLRKAAPKYGARILTTASVINDIGDFDRKFNARFIGFLHIRANGLTEKLYDVFDGDEENNKLFKKQTKDLFERGVNLYCAREFYEARLVFIEVLKRFRDDGAAQEYLFLCDRYYQREDTSDISVAVETY